MRHMNATGHQRYLTLMAAYWIVFGLITTFYPALMDLFQTEAGVQAKSAFSNHVWRHGGLDILALVAVLLALSRERAVSANTLRGVAVAALMPTLAIAYSVVATPFWNPLFIVAGLGTLTFAVWGWVLAGSVGNR
jgi:hypothetical protein